MEFTIAEVLEAGKKNGYPWTVGTSINGLGESCYLGQATRNLFPDIDNSDFIIVDKLMWGLFDALRSVVGRKNAWSIIDYNDLGIYSYAEIHEYATKVLGAYSNKTITVPYEKIVGEYCED